MFANIARLFVLRLGTTNFTVHQDNIFYHVSTHRLPETLDENLFVSQHIRNRGVLLRYSDLLVLY